MADNFVIKGHIIHTPQCGRFEVTENGFLVCIDGRSAGVFSWLPSSCQNLPVRDFGDSLVIPGLADTHVHAPQYAFRGLGMDMELIQWLNQNTFAEELKYGDPAYAEEAYRIFAEDLKNSGTTRAVVFGTVHKDATLRLMELLEETGLKCLVGKVNMDRNGPEGLLDSADTDAALEETEDWIRQSLERFERTRPVLTPRFIPSCSEALLEGLGRLQKKYNLPVQSHLSESPDEVRWVKELCPWSSCYGDAYDRFGLFGKEAGDDSRAGNTVPTVMAHCVHPTEEEFALLQKRQVLVSHCPSSNANLISGIAPVSRYLDAGIPVALGTDIAAGYDLSVFRAMTDAVQWSKLRCRFTDETDRPITLAEAFYMGTKGGGSLFGKVGSFEEGYELDVVVLDDSALRTPRKLTVQERLERAIYLEKDVKIAAKFAAGQEIL